MKKSEWLDCQGNEFFPKQKGTPSLVKIEHKNTATLDSARSKKNLKWQFCNYIYTYFKDHSIYICFFARFGGKTSTNSALEQIQNPKRSTPIMH